MIFAPAFQPIKDVGTGSFVAAEVLARWYDEGRVPSLQRRSKRCGL